MPLSRVPSPSRHRTPTAASALLAVVALLVGGVALLPQLGAVGFAASVLLPSLAPFLLGAALVGILLAAPGARRGSRTARAAVLCAGAAALVPVASLGGVGLAAARLGATIHPLAALTPGPMAAAPDRTARYAPGETGRIDIYEPPAGTPVAGILFDVHGGGWNTDAQMPATLRWFADHGWVVARPQYRLARPSAPTWDLAPHDVARAYAWVVDHARELGTDPHQVSVLGDSAGGGLGIDLAYQVAGGTSPYPEVAGAPAPRAVVALYPTVDVAAVAGVRTLGAGNAAIAFVGGSPAEHPERYAQLDASRWVGPHAPPTLVIQGTWDTFVPPSSVRTFVDRARRAGTDVTSTEVPLANHAFDCQARGSAGFQLVTSGAQRFLLQHR